MLSPHPPESGLKTPKQYEAELKERAANPRLYGVPRTVPPSVAALGRKGVELFQQAESATPEAAQADLDAKQAEAEAAERASKINLAIARVLHGKEEMGADGKPNVARLNELTGLKDITAAERDEHWAVVEEPAPKKK